MARQKKPSSKKLSLYPLTFDEAVAGLLATPPPPDKADKKSQQKKRVSRPKRPKPKSEKPKAGAN